MPPRSVSNTQSTPRLTTGTGGTANGRASVSAMSKGRGRAAGREKSVEESSSEQNIVVGVRLRPFVAYEKGQAGCISIQDNQVIIAPKNLGVHRREVNFGEKTFAFDYVMDSSDPEQRCYVSQQMCYAIMCDKMVERMFEGYATCLFAYGQTASGKTTTIMGDLQDDEEQGILVRLIRDTFARVDALKNRVDFVQCKVQMLEVYNERIQDLLAPSDKDKAEEGSDVTVHMHPQLGAYAKNASEDSVDDLATCMKILEYGNNMRSVAATAINSNSSRGHTLFKLTVERREANHMVTSSQAFFVDLAGCENEKTTLVTGDRLIELSFINKSLMLLAQCIDALRKPAQDKGNDQRFLFRNSKLTMLLSDALSRDSRTAMIGTLSPALSNFEESLTTLNFCSTVKQIKVDAKARRGLDKDGLLKSLQEELACLRGGLAPMSNQQQINNIQATADEYRRKLEEEQLKVEEAQDARMEEAQDARMEALHGRLQEMVKQLQLQVSVEQPRDPFSPLSDRDATLSLSDDSGRTGEKSSGSSSNQRSSSCAGRRRNGPSKSHMNEASSFRRDKESSNHASMRHVPKTVNLEEEYSSTVQEKVTTLMVRNIPDRYTQRELITELEDLGFAGTFDFLYIPLGKAMSNAGYGFVNFVSQEWAAKCMDSFQNYRFKRHGKAAGKIAAVSVAHLQGLQANLAHYEKAAVNTAKLKKRRPVVMVNISSKLSSLLCDDEEDFREPSASID